MVTGDRQLTIFFFFFFFLSKGKKKKYHVMFLNSFSVVGGIHFVEIELGLLAFTGHGTDDHNDGPK